MSKTILVTYASRNGSTAGVANFIAKTLSENGEQVEVLPMKEVYDISSYYFVIAGSAIQAGQWLPEAIDFVKKHQTSLTLKPFAAFLVCMTLAMPKADKYREFVEGWLNPVRTMVKPQSEACFAGALDIKNLSSFTDRLKFRLSIIFGVWKEGDHRNWDAIRMWANSLRPMLNK